MQSISFNLWVYFFNFCFIIETYLINYQWKGKSCYFKSDITYFLIIKMNCTEFMYIYLKTLKKKTQLSKSLLFRRVNFCLKNQSIDGPKKSGKISNQYNPCIIQEVLVRRFEPKEVPTKTQNLVIGSNQVKILVGGKYYTRKYLRTWLSRLNNLWKKLKL